jgi:hypothetical protein
MWIISFIEILTLPIRMLIITAAASKTANTRNTAMYLAVFLLLLRSIREAFSADPII